MNCVCVYVCVFITVAVLFANRKVCEPSVNRTVNLHPNLSDYNGRREASRCQVPLGHFYAGIYNACVLAGEIHFKSHRFSCLY